MSYDPSRLITALLWPLTIWGSLKHFDEHPSDDYVERTTPILAFAIGFWVCAALLVVLSLIMSDGRTASAAFEQAEVSLLMFDQRWQPLATALMWFLPAIYVIGLWMFTTRAERFPAPRTQHVPRSRTS